MKPSITRVTVALITFLIGVALPSTTPSRQSQVSPQPAAVNIADQILVKPLPEPKQSPAIPEEKKTAKGTDLSLVIETFSTPPSFDVRHIKLAKNGKTIIGLDLSESIDGQEVMLHLPDRSASYRVLERYRTSMTISAEGPHLDLVDWRHFDSQWTPLKSLGANRFRTLRSEQMDYSEFPKTSKAEIIKEVRRRVGKDWPKMIELVQDCNGPNDSNCIVTISSIYLRIQKQVDDRWIDVGMVEVAIPMGC